MSTAPPNIRWRTAGLILTTVVGVVTMGYLVGLNIELRHHNNHAASAHGDPAAGPDADDNASIPAISYSEMRQRETGPTSQWHPMSMHGTSVDTDFRRCITCHNSHTAEVHPSDTDKLRSLATRGARRAFNGAPPVVPHAIERTDDAACYACHGQGARIGDRVANRMSHGLLVNCLQCHAAPPPRPFAQVEVATTNTFEGIPAPIAGERAFAGAPPTIPHSTWMRDRCLSCHGVAGWPGLEVTHRWRTNCLQCHAPSAELEQAIAADLPKPARTLSVSAVDWRQP